jgi:site-specific DNA recombinase
MRAGLYIRVSTSMQIEKESLKTQEERLKAYCKANNIPEYKIYKDAGISAKDTKRPALEKLMTDIETEKIQMVIVTKLDRITRSLKDLIQMMEFFEKNKVKFISITQNIDTTGPMGRFMLNLLGSVAQVEREMTAERVGEDLLHRALAGKYNGGIVPYGYTTRASMITELKKQGYTQDAAFKEASKIEPKKFIINEKEAEEVKKIYDMYLKLKSIRGVTEQLNAEGYRTRHKLPWAAASILRVLTNPTYTGKIWYGKRKTNPLTGRLEQVPEKDWKIVKGEHERIIDDDIFYRVQEIIKQSSYHQPRPYNTYLLSGLLRCGRCNGPMYGYVYKGKYTSRKTKHSRIKKYFWYRCHTYGQKGKAICKGLVIPGDKIEEIVIKELTNLSKNEEFIKDKNKMLELVRKKLKPTAKSCTESIKKLETEERKLQNRQQNLLERLEDDVIDNLTFKNEFNRLKALLEDNQARQTKLKSSNRNSEMQLAGLELSLAELENLSKTWDLLDEQGKRATLLAIVKEIIVNGQDIKIRIFVDTPEEVINAFSIPGDISKAGFINIGGFRIVANLFRRGVPAGGTATVHIPATAPLPRYLSTGERSQVRYLTG